VWELQFFIAEIKHTEMYLAAPTYKVLKQAEEVPRLGAVVEHEEDFGRH
jgi:hypothetical protein